MNRLLSRLRRPFAPAARDSEAGRTPPPSIIPAVIEHQAEASGEEGSSHPSAAYSPARRGLMLFVLFLVSTSSYLDRTMLSVALEPIKLEFHVTDSMLGLLSGASFAVLYVTLGIPVARWADRGDRKLIITGALAIWSAMTTLCGFTVSFLQLALVRIGVGAGEAGAMAPAQSLLADYFPPHQRARAISVFMISVTAGNFLGLSGGGWLTQTFGWRAMFLAAGLPGLLLAPLVFTTLSEPRLSSRSAPSAESFRATIIALGTKPSYLMAVAAMALFFGVAYGPLTFVVPFLARVHGMRIGEAGAIAGFCTAVGGLAGNLLGGALTDRLSKQDIRWLAWIPAAGVLAIGGFYQGAFLVAAPWVMIALLFCGGVVTGAAYPPMYALLHAVCGSVRRVTAIAAALFVANLVGFGLGPLSVGVLSDQLAHTFGSAVGLQYALAIVSAALIPAGLLFFRAAAHLRADLEH